MFTPASLNLSATFANAPGSSLSLRTRESSETVLKPACENVERVVVGVGGQGDDALLVEALGADVFDVDAFVGERPADVREDANFVLCHYDDSVHTVAQSPDSDFACRSRRQSSTTISILSRVMCGIVMRCAMSS